MGSDPDWKKGSDPDWGLTPSPADRITTPSPRIPSLIAGSIGWHGSHIG